MKDIFDTSGRTWAGYATALVLSVIALGIRQFSVTNLEQPTVVVLLVPIVVGAYVGGFGAALLATVLVSCGSAVIPAHFLSTGLQAWMQWTSIWAVGVLVSLLAWSRQRHERRALELELAAATLASREAVEETRRSAEARLLEQAREVQLFKFVADRSIVPFCIVDPADDLKLIYVNEAAVKHFGYPKEEILRLRVTDFDAEFAGHVVKPISREQRESGSLVLETTHRVIGGRTIPVEVSLNSFSYQGKELIAAWFTDISRRKRIEDSLKASEDALRNVFNSIADATAIHDKDGRILDVNMRFLSLFRVGPEEAGGRNLLEFCRSKPDSEGPERVWARAIAGEAQLLDWQATRPSYDGERAELQVFLRASRWSGQDVIVAQIRDVTQSRRAEQDLRDREASLRLLAETSTHLLRSDDPQQLLREVFDSVATHLGVEVYFNYLVSDDGTHLVLNASMGIDEQTARSSAMLQFGQALCGTAAQRRERIIRCDVQKSTDPIASFVRALGVRAYACHPLIADNLLGTISFGAKNRDVFSERDLELMRAVADQASMAMARHSLNVELAKRAADLDQANQAKDHFLAILSHELRTPLTPVLASATFLRDDQRLPKEFREDVEMIVRNTDLEARLIDDLLDVTRIARGKTELYRRPVDLRDILKRAIEVCRPDLEARDISLEVAIRDRGRYQVSADSARLQQVFWNLLKNAVKFTPAGGEISIRCGQRDGQVAVQVSDTGEGIDPSVMDRIFNAFEQAGKTRQFGGLGLGLAISRSLVELHGGTITAQSAGKGKGSTFTVTLPLLEETAASKSAAPAGVTAKPKGPLRILLVEDHGDTAHIMKRMLALDGHVVQIAGDVATAIRLAANQPFDLLISDLGLPDGSGMDVVRSIRTRGVNIPAVALSGFGQDDDVQRSRQAGFTTHLTKPVDVSRLKQTIREVTN